MPRAGNRSPGQFQPKTPRVVSPPAAGPSGQPTTDSYDAPFKRLQDRPPPSRPPPPLPPPAPPAGLDGSFAEALWNVEEYIVAELRGKLAECHQREVRRLEGQLEELRHLQHERVSFCSSCGRSSEHGKAASAEHCHRQWCQPSQPTAGCNDDPMSFTMEESASPRPRSSLRRPQQEGAPVTKRAVSVDTLGTKEHLLHSSGFSSEELSSTREDDLLAQVTTGSDSNALAIGGTRSHDESHAVSSSRAPSSRVPSSVASVHKKFVARDVWAQNIAFNDLANSTLSKKKMQKKNASRAFTRAGNLTEAFIRLNRLQEHVCVFHPYSKVRLAWGLLGLILLSYDFIVQPLQVFFELEQDDAILRLIDWIALTFWTSDIALSFRTGVYIYDELSMEPKVIACQYARTWLTFDLSLVTMDLCILVIRSTKYVKFLGLMRAVRLLRFLRMLRLSKLVLVLLAPIRDQLPHIHTPHMAILVKLLLTMCIGAHIIACAWYSIGLNDGGWVNRANFEEQDARHKYLASLYWSLQGQSLTFPNLVSEYSFAIVNRCAVYISLAAFFAVAVLTVGEARKPVHTTQMHRACVRFLQRHSVSPDLSRRVKRWLDGYYHQQGLGEQREEEKLLMSMLPGVLQADLHLEIRETTIFSYYFLWDLHNHEPRVVRDLCYKAMSDVVLMNEEIVFETFDACSRMLFVEDGRLWYGLLGDMEFADDKKKRSVRRVSGNHNAYYAGSQFISKFQGNAVSEAVLWTVWEHCGRLQAMQDSLLLAMDATAFGHVIEEHTDATVFASKYCKMLLYRLNTVIQDRRGLLSDLMRFCPETDSLELLLSVDIDSHYIFLSHFKEEAGTEASLICDGLTRALTDVEHQTVGEFAIPVFLDSENLHDLNRLEAHVQKSHNFILMLTPGILKRPWCLLETVIAFRSNATIVPVEVQRKGAAFEYPDDSYYERLSRGEELDDGARNLLSREGIELAELVATLRHVFSLISKPFSPHKSHAIRQVELAEILKRCQRRTSRS